MQQSPSPQTTPDTRYRILIVDDSTIIRRLIGRVFENNAQFKIVATAENGERAIAALKEHPVDIIILDIEMPVMDGLTAIPHLKTVDPAVQIIMASTLTQKNAEISFRAMRLGATDYIPKPSGVGNDAPTDFQTDLLEKARALSLLARKKGVRGYNKPALALKPQKPFTLRAEPMFRPSAIAIGSSTGGPEALIKLIRGMGPDLPQPILITQHMPPTFTSILAANIGKHCQVTCTEGKDGEILKPGHYYMAPGDYHMLVEQEPDQMRLRIVQEERENFCRPAVDPMLRSLASAYGRRMLVIILTGMGQDGCKGSEAVVASGGSVIAQDEASSVVWGMPGAVATAGLCSKVLPIGDIAATVRHLALKADI